MGKSAAEENGLRQNQTKVGLLCSKVNTLYMQLICNAP